MASKSDFTPEEWKTNRCRCANGWTCGYVRQSQRAMGRYERDVVDGNGHGGNAGKRQ